ncbi:SusC/RagA family TonB-linked outer membrane protein [Flavimarina sp. Hel_I_48]|uniref:SusC/RagA family TonB-linked outer membrane protein n=1 Tax=Flavimarina sp. Hel_I_48 TaxID=1392488 RepID=UPI0004DFB6AB|nr:SusC/RagA family TonB-linked outer membrane protein [Flavimarina sp. Hel_I_48]
MKINLTQLFRKHKITPFHIFFILSTLTIATAKANNDQDLRESFITTHLEDVTITEVFKSIEAQTAFTFVYDDALVQSEKRFNLQATHENLESALNRLGKQASFTFKAINTTITVLSQDASQQTITGKVTDEAGMPLPGATVMQKGGNRGTTTDFDGNFSLAVSETSTVLVISYVGFQTEEIPAAQGTPITVVLKTSENALDEVVVTALGIKRSQKKLGFSQASISGDNLDQTNPNNWSSGLKGKVAGLNFLSAGSGPINSQKITLRGDASLNPNNNAALIVIDGVPIDQEINTSGTGSAYGGNDSPIDFGNVISDLNSQDIESVSVLKGAGATALYGSRGQNGVVLITTKSGKRGSGLGVTYNSSVSFDIIQRWPDWQYKYGQGSGKSFDEDGEPYYSYGASPDGSNTGSTSSAWGPEFNGQYYYQYDPTIESQSTAPQLWRPYKDNRKDFWNTGMTFKNSISLAGGDDNGSLRASVGHSKNEWIMPNTGYELLNASVNATYDISDRINVSSLVNYSNRTSDNIPSTGYNNGSIAYFMIFQNPNVAMDWYRPIWQQDQFQIQQIQPFSSYIDNPYLIAYEATNGMQNDQLIGNLTTTIKLADKWNLLLRTALNTYNQERQLKRPYSINRYAQGYYETQSIWKQDINSDFLLTFDSKITEDFSVQASAGGNSRDYKYRRVDASVEDLVVPGVYKLANGVNNPLVGRNDSNFKVNSLYALANFSFRDQIFVDLTARNDWSSTLPKKNDSYFYPSVSSSFILSDIFNMSGTMDYLKYRFSFARIGNDTGPYRTSKYYSQSDFPSSATVPTTLYNIDFKPEVSSSFETGLDIRFFKSRLRLDATVYQTNTKNQILDVPIDITTGYSSATLNSGEVRNRGLEFTLLAQLFKKDKFSWESTLTFSKNWNKVLSLAEGIDNQQVIGEGGQATILAKVGGSASAVYGYGFLRSPDGRIIYDDAGLPAYPESGDIQKIGDANPDFRAGLYNSFRLGNVSLNVMLDAQKGGIIYSQTHHKLTEQGKLKSTYYGREDGFIVGDGVVLNDDGTYSENTTEAATPDWYTRYYRRANVESNSFDASYIKLREISLQYNMPAKWLRGTGIQDLNLNFFGRNLAMITDFPIYDPETAALNGSTLLPGVEIGQMPSPATYGMGLQVKF